MVHKDNKRGYLFDDTPRGMMEFLLIGGGLVATLSVAPTLLAVLAAVGYAFNASDVKTRQKIQNSFQYLLHHGYVSRVVRGRQ